MNSWTNTDTWRANLILTKNSHHYRLIRRYVAEQSDDNLTLLKTLLEQHNALTSDIAWDELTEAWILAEHSLSLQ